MNPYNALTPAVVLAGLFLVPHAAPAQPLNVVLIIGDDQAWGDYGFMGHPVIRTPHLHRLASESVVFTRGYVPSSLCRPPDHEAGLRVHRPSQRQAVLPLFSTLCPQQPEEP